MRSDVRTGPGHQGPRGPSVAGEPAMTPGVQVIPNGQVEHGGGGVATMEHPRVLVVDDDQGFREMLRDFLADDGFDVIGEAPDGAQACTLAQELQPDVVLMDVRMPRMDGLEASRTSIRTTTPR